MHGNANLTIYRGIIIIFFPVLYSAPDQNSGTWMMRMQKKEVEEVGGTNTNYAKQ
jgi:hypothetical protein